MPALAVTTGVCDSRMKGEWKQEGRGVGTGGTGGGVGLRGGQLEQKGGAEGCGTRRVGEWEQEGRGVKARG